MDVTWWQ